MKNVFSSPFLAFLVFVWLGSNCCSSARSPIVIRKYANDCATAIATSSVRCAALCCRCRRMQIIVSILIACYRCVFCARVDVREK